MQQTKRVSFFFFLFFFLINMQQRIMKAATANPLPTWHVRSLLHDTCDDHPSEPESSSTFPPLRTRQNRFITNTREISRRSRAQPRRKTLTTMGEREAIIEAQSKFRSEFLQVLRSRRTTQGITTVTD